MSQLASTDTSFHHALTEAITRTGEVLILIQFSHAAGRMQFELINTREAALARVQSLQPQARMTAFFQPQLPVRGRVDDDFIRRALAEIPDHSLYLVLTPPHETPDAHTSFCAGECHAELSSDLSAMRGDLVAVGLYPSYVNSLTAIAPDLNGKIVPGVY